MKVKIVCTGNEYFEYPEEIDLEITPKHIELINKSIAFLKSNPGILCVNVISEQEFPDEADIEEHGGVENQSFLVYLTGAVYFRANVIGDESAFFESEDLSDKIKEL